MLIKTEDFKKILQTIKPAISKREVVEQSTHFIFTGTDATAYNDRICISYPCESDFVCSVNSDDMSRIINGFSSTDIEITMKDNQLQVKGKKARSGLACIEEGPIMKMIQDLNTKNLLKNYKWYNLPAEFNEALNLCLFSASKDVSLVELSCLSISNKGIISSDNLRISSYSLSIDVPRDFLIPLSSAEELAKIKVTKLLLTEAWAHFATEENIIFSCRIVSAEYPDVFEFFEMTDAMKLEMPKNLKKTIDSIIFSVEGDIDIDKKMQLTITDNKICCRAEKQNCWIEQDIDIEYNSETIQFDINPIFLAQILEKSTTMKIEPGKALFESGDNFKHVMAMPI